MATQEQRSASTRGKLMSAGRKLFAERGYDATSLEDVTRATRLTKGALYHHFADKRALFRAVFETLEGELVEAVTAMAVGGDAWARFRAGCRAFLEKALVPEIQRIVLRDAPAVLGWDDFRAIDAAFNAHVIGTGLRAAIAEGHVEVDDPDTLALLLLGTLCEGARLIANARDPRAALRSVAGEIDDMLVARAKGPRPAKKTTSPPRASSSPGRGAAGPRAAKAVSRSRPR